MVETTFKTFGRVDTLVNNPALDYPAPITDFTVVQWNEVIGHPERRFFYACKAVFPIMMKQGGGYIFDVSSVADKPGWPNATAYCASKFALTGFTQALIGERRPHNIRRSVTYPGGWIQGGIKSEIRTF